MFIKKFNEFEFIIPSEIEELSDIFQKNGHKLFIVGGFVRDFLLGLKPLDIDLSTDSLPDQTISFLKNNYKLDLVGKAFGVIIVHFGKMKIEIASFRKDITKGRHPEVELGSTIEDDVRRRDLTISSIFYDIQEGRIVDLVGGVSDINNGIIRMVGDPKERLEEDQLRSLRAVRFSSRYEFKIDKKTSNALRKYTDLSKISPERIWEEFKKSFSQAKNFNTYLNYITELGLWNDIFPGSNINTKLVDSSNFIIIITNLFKNENTDLLEKMTQDYRIEFEIAKQVVFLVNLKNFNPDDVYQIYKMRQQSGIESSTILEWLKVNGINDPLLIKFVDYRPTISAKDLISKGFKQDNLGREIKRLEAEKFKQQ